MSKSLIFSLIMLGSVFISACSQIILKKASGRQYESRVAEYLNFPVIFSYGIFFLSFLISGYCLRVIPLSLAPVLEATSFIFVTILGKLILKEKVTPKKIAGLLVITVGVIIASL